MEIFLASIYWARVRLKIMTASRAAGRDLLTPRHRKSIRGVVVSRHATLRQHSNRLPYVNPSKAKNVLLHIFFKYKKNVSISVFFNFPTYLLFRKISDRRLRKWLIKI